MHHTPEESRKRLCHFYSDLKILTELIRISLERRKKKKRITFITNIQN